MMYGGDDIGAIVLDLGSQSIRIGTAQDDAPKSEIPSMVGVSNDGTPDTSALEPGAKCSNRINGNTKYFIDVTSLRVPRKDKEVINCMKDGMIDDWDLFEKILDYSYSKCLHTKSQYHPILFSESPFNTKPKREKLVELMFEKYQVPAIYLCRNAVLAAFSCGRPTCIIVDSGAIHTSAIPVHDGFIIHSAVVKCPLGGNFISMQCKEFLAENNIEVTPHYMIAQKTPVKEKEKPIWTKKRTLPEVTDSWYNYMCQSVIQDFQQSVLQISETPYDEKIVSTLPTSHYEFPNGYNQDFGNERFKIPEMLFDPSPNLGGSMLSMSHIVVTSAGMCDVDLRPTLYNNIVVTGGNSLIQGFPERLNRDLTARIPPSMRLKMISPNGSTERRFGAWIGGSIIASTGTFQQMWFSSQEYNEGGKDVITKLETRDLTLVDSLNIVEETVQKLEIVKGKIGQIINTKVKNILQKNAGFAQMKAIKNILTGCSSEVSLDVELTPSDIAKMQYCPIKSVEVERSFSRYKAILRPNQRSFELKN